MPSAESGAQCKVTSYLPLSPVLFTTESRKLYIACPRKSLRAKVGPAVLPASPLSGGLFARLQKPLRRQASRNDWLSLILHENLLRVIDHNHLERTLPRLQLQPEL